MSFSLQREENDAQIRNKKVKTSKCQKKAGNFQAAPYLGWRAILFPINYQEQIKYIESTRTVL